ncbi:hypothetical protein ACFL6X_08975 [Candidatus Latescibacterota bacterium]
MGSKTWGSCQVREREYQGLLLVAEYDGNKHLYGLAEVVLLKYLEGHKHIALTTRPPAAVRSERRAAHPVTGEPLSRWWAIAGSNH